MVDHITLQILKGVFRAPGDSASVEAEMDGLDLLNVNGLALQTQGWSPQLPALKGSTAYAESAIADGRQPLSGAVGNVTETMRLTMANVDLRQRMATFKKLSQLKSDVEAFWTTNWQIEPVYIRWHAALGAGDQYALIYNLEMAQDTDIFDLDTSWDITLTLEREPYWRGIWPGGNPLEWTFEFRGIPRGSQEFDVNDMDLGAGVDHLIFDDSISNKHEWYPTPPNAYVNTISNNYVDVESSLIPGDAPALLELDIDWADAGSLTPEAIYVARSTKPTLGTGHDGVQRATASIYAFGDATTLGAGVTKVVDATNGVISNGTSATRYRVDMSFSTNPATVDFNQQSRPLIDYNLSRGTYALFIRNAQQAGAQGDIDLTWQLFGISSGSPVLVSLTGKAHFSTATGLWGYTYMGTFTLPPSGGAIGSSRGYGLDYFPSDNGLPVFRLSANRPTGVSTLQLLDWILFPVDEWMVKVLNNNTSTSGLLNERYLLDTTGYLSHGKPGLNAIKYQDADFVVPYVYEATEIRGPEMTLVPNMNNRLYFWQEAIPTTVQDTRSNPHATFTVRGNIVPRWTGIRDV